MFGGLCAGKCGREPCGVAVTRFDATAPALRLRGVSKTFPGVRALSGLDLDVRTGTVHALLGHNGSGKSTAIKLLAGLYSADPGSEAWVGGQRLHLGDAAAASRCGLRFVHQDLGIVPELSVAENFALGTGFERGRFGLIDWPAQRAQAQALLARFGFDIDVDAPLGAASPSARAAVAIVRAITDWPEAGGVLVLDEPTAALAAREVDRLFELVRAVTREGGTVIFVGHRLDEIMTIADNATLLRDGLVVWDGPLADTSLQGLVSMIANDEDAVLETGTKRQAVGSAPAAQVVLDCRGIEGEFLNGVDLVVRSGEIVGVAGLLGSGREELPYLLGGDPQSVARGDLASVQAGSGTGISFVPADRLRESIFEGFTTAENVSLAGLPSIRQRGVVTYAAERRAVESWLAATNTDVAYAPRPILTLSGGNQQKAVLARALSTNPSVLVLSEPTAGVDIGARRVIYEELKRRAGDGLAIVVASSDVEDLLACCTRVVVLRDGKVTAEFDAPLSKTAITYAIEGAHEQQD